MWKCSLGLKQNVYFGQAFYSKTSFWRSVEDLAKSRAIVFHASLANARVEEFIGDRCFWSCSFCCRASIVQTFHTALQIMVCIWDTVNFSVFDPLDREWDKILPTKARKNHMVICQSSFLSLMVRLTAPPIPRAHLKMAEFEFWFSLNAHVDCNASESGNWLGFTICTCHFSSWFPLGLPSTSTQVGERKTKCQKTCTKVTSDSGFSSDTDCQKNGT